MKLEYQEPVIVMTMLSSSNVISTSGGTGGAGGDSYLDLPGQGYD